MIKKSLITLVLIIAFAGRIFCQNNISKILIFSPNDFKFEKSFKSEIKDINYNISKNKLTNLEYDQAIESLENYPPNSQLSMKSFYEYDKTLSFRKILSSETFIRLNIDKDENSLILLSQNSSNGDVEEIEKIAKSQQIQFVINYPKIELYKNNGIAYIKVRVQLFDNVGKKLLMDDEFIGDWLINQDITYGPDIQNKTLEVAIRNVLYSFIDKMSFLISANVPEVKEQILLNKQRFNNLTNTNKINESELVLKIVNETDKTLSKLPFITLLDSSKTKFIAFFNLPISKEEFEARESYRQTIDFYLDAEEYANRFENEYNKGYKYSNVFIYSGVLYENQWYFLKYNETYLKSRSEEEGKLKYYNIISNWKHYSQLLLKSDFYNEMLIWNYYKENSMDINLSFWETGFFKKVQNPSEDSSKPMISPEELYDKLDDLENEYEDFDSFEQFLMSEDFLELTGGYSFEEIIKGDYLETERKSLESNYQPYIGYYEVVATHLMKEAKTKAENFKRELIKSTILPNAQKIISEYNFNIINYSDLENDTLLIYPFDRSVIITPIIIFDKDWKKHIRYLAMIKNENESYETFEWRYINQRTYVNINGYKEIIEQLLNLTEWNYQYDYLNDSNFWDNYVLLKDGNEYKYLSKIIK